jgi:hypothetical protein
VSVFISRDALLGRRSVALGALSALTKGLRSELEPLVRAPHEVPTAKALLSRRGGRCECDGALLPYHPFDERHRCPRCGREWHGEEHDRFRLYWHQLWLAERTVHASLLAVLLGDASCQMLASDLLEAWTVQYLAYPNADNVLGPSRPFFSTYLESIWLVQLCVALDLLEQGAPSAAMSDLGQRVRDRVIAPSVALIASFDEGMSNRQVWNNAAMLAAAPLLGDEALRERALHSASGLEAHLASALLSDGSWYEGENYHLFAHRGLWYGVQMAQTAGVDLPAELLARFDAGFVAPFRSVLPDLTYPSRRDSQYAVSVRQLRFAESCELGLVRRVDDRLAGWLGRLYDPAIRRGETGRATSTADVERNHPPTGLIRTDLSWRTLLLAREHLPALKPQPLESDLLPGQGLGILRRDGGTVYVGLDYGHSGGGHGHPDRLNLVLADGARRWFDDPGTGSYVDESLHWYRSTLAHNAPVIDGRSQPRVHGRLLAFADDGRAGWMSGLAELAPGLRVRRSVVVMEGYLIDELEWDGDETHDIALPMHGVMLVDDEGHELAREAAVLDDGGEPEDGFTWLHDVARYSNVPATALAVSAHERAGAPPAAAHRLHGWIMTGRGTTWLAATAPRAPGLPGRERLLLARRRATSGRLTAVWGWRDAVRDVQRAGETLVIGLRNSDRHVHRRTDLGWRVETADRLGAHRSVDLAGPRAPSVGPPSLLQELLDDPVTEDAPVPEARTLPATLELGEPHYRRSELSWAEAGSPAAELTVRAPAGVIALDVRVAPSERLFIAPEELNPYDNEPAGVNGDGVQLYLSVGDLSGGWLLVPVAGRDAVIVRPASGWQGGLEAPVARWHATEHGYAMHVELAIDPATTTIGLDLIVNETASGRVRRRGQLVLSGANGEFVYLRGDRHDHARLLSFTRPDA